MGDTGMSGIRGEVGAGEHVGMLGISQMSREGLGDWGMLEFGEEGRGWETWRCLIMYTRIWQKISRQLDRHPN